MNAINKPNEVSMFKVGDYIVGKKPSALGIKEILKIVVDLPDRYQCVSHLSPSVIVLKSHIDNWELAAKFDEKAAKKIICIGPCQICSGEMTEGETGLDCFNPKCQEYRENQDLPEGWTITPFNKSFDLPDKPKFKYGEKLVPKSSKVSNKVYTIFARELLPNLSFHYGCRQNGHEVWFQDTELRHATPKEIAAGHRIDCEILDHPEDYTSPNCKKYER